ncbi:OmpA family protein [Halomonas campisalis]|uniref:OmpA family protein n=1 Tax=Billgrantia campisalis TaxID=74661 RepID=A0ABS9P387_9GAMM|nr:OmpA family protein [Halomonas campisalis]MCG6656239.1 OmpA family protein [Halomonas campisalis]MDR5861426.1 OmpA family protein [Halomonas campisalis]
MIRPTASGTRDHRGPMRHESLTPPHHDHDQDSAWMIGYLDVMTLLVALLVLIFTLSFAGGGTDEAPSPVEPLASPGVVPLPPALQRALAARPQEPGYPAAVAGRLSPAAVSAALGVAGRPPRPAQPRVPPLLARPLPTVALASGADRPPLEERVPMRIALPQAVLQTDQSLPSPLADYMLVLTDRPPARTRELSPEAVASAEALDERVAESPYLPDLEGVAVSRVAEGIKLQVEDQWLFPTAEADLTEQGEALVGRLVELIQRHDGEVAVEGHTDSRPIQTPEFPSNWVLSSARAIAIVHALERAGVATSRLRAVGLADTRPLADNDTAEGRAQNRRVEVIIHAQ